MHDRIVTYSTLILGLFLLISCSASAPKEPILIAHAMGGINEDVYTNSLEAFEQNYLGGKRFFELDLMFTKDARLVGFHDADMEEKLGIPGHVWDTTYQDFMSQKYKGGYTPLNLLSVIKILQAHEDITLITDIKTTYEPTMMLLSAFISANDPSLFSRIIPQIYSQEDMRTLRDIYAYERVIYAVYKSEDTDEQLAEFVKNTPEVWAVSIGENRFSEELAMSIRHENRHVFVHTINDANKAQEYMNKGATGFYTDFLK